MGSVGGGGRDDPLGVEDQWREGHQQNPYILPLVNVAQNAHVGIHIEW